jgi:hypothetical protein
LNCLAHSTKGEKMSSEKIWRVMLTPEQREKVFVAPFAGLEEEILSGQIRNANALRRLASGQYEEDREAILQQMRKKPRTRCKKSQTKRGSK